MWISKKHQKSIAENCKSPYTINAIYFKIYLSNETIQRLNCVMGHLNLKFKKKLAKTIDLHFCGAIK